MGISTYKLTKGINAPSSRIQDILHDRHRISVEMFVWLGRYFDVFSQRFLNIQGNIDIRNVKLAPKSDLDKITPFQLLSHI